MTSPADHVTNFDSFLICNFLSLLCFVQDSIRDILKRLQSEGVKIQVCNNFFREGWGGMWVAATCYRLIRA